MTDLISRFKIFVASSVGRIVIILDFVFLFFCSARHADRVVLVRLDAIGDLFLWLPYASVYKKVYPGSELILIANSAWADFARMLPYWDSVYSIDTVRMVRNPFYRWRTLRRVRNISCATVIHSTYSREILCGDSVVRALRANEKLGSVGDLSNINELNKKRSDRWYTTLVAASSSAKMELDRNAEFVTNLYGLDVASAEKDIPLHDVVLREELLIDEKYFIIFPGASWVGKVWPLSRYSKLASWVRAEYGLRLVICGASKEAGMGDALLAQSNCSDGINLVGKTSLVELYQVVRRACFLVGNDTSAVHIAAASGTPSICVIGGGHYGRFMPYPSGWYKYNPIPVHNVMSCYGCGWRCTQEYDDSRSVPCIDSVEVEEVKSAIRQLVRSTGMFSTFIEKSLR